MRHLGRIDWLLIFGSLLLLPFNNQPDLKTASTILTAFHQNIYTIYTIYIRCYEILLKISRMPPINAFSSTVQFIFCKTDLYLMSTQCIGTAYLHILYNIGLRVYENSMRSLIVWKEHLDCLQTATHNQWHIWLTLDQKRTGLPFEEGMPLIGRGCYIRDRHL